jgi:hypothetical protein
MKKLLVIPIMGAYYLLMVVMIPIQLLLIFVSKTAEWVEDFTNQVSIYYEDYLMKPAARIQSYALQIMRSDKTIKWIEEASKKLKQGKPID